MRCFFLVLSCVMIVWPPAARCGESMAGSEGFFPPERIIAFAKRVEKSLAENGARVAIVARVGRPRKSLPQGISFTHAGIAVYSHITTRDGRVLPGYAMYNLYQKFDEPEKSHLIRDYPVDFFAGVQVLEAGIIIPAPALQKAMLKVVMSKTYTALHNPDYSAIANPYTSERQNCTEYLLDILFAAIYKIDDIRRIKANEAAYYKAQPLSISPVKLVFGEMFAADISTRDHPDVHSLKTATFTTIADFLESFGLVAHRYTLTEEAPAASGAGTKSAAISP